MKNVQTLRRMFGLAAIVALIGLVAASCDNAASTNIGCGYALCACGVCASASCDCESVANDCGYAECGCENCEGTGCDCDEQQAQAITVDMGGGVTMTMNWIAPGTFTQGHDSVPSGATRREVTLTRGFFMGIHSVTQEQFYAVMGVNPSNFSSNPAEGEEQGRRPVETVNWYHAIAFANRLSIMLELEPVYYIPSIDLGNIDVCRRTYNEQCDMERGDGELGSQRFSPSHRGRVGILCPRRDGYAVDLWGHCCSLHR